MDTEVYFKHEDEVRGQAVGPVLVITDPKPSDAMIGRPYQTKCVCDDYADKGQRSTERNEWGYPLCPDCGDELPPLWVTIGQARAIAQEHGVELIES